MMQSDADEREESRTIHGKLRRMRENCEKSVGGQEYAIIPINA